MQPQLKDILHHYMGQKVQIPGAVSWAILSAHNYPYFKDGCVLALRPLDSMTEDEMIGLLQSMVPDGMPDKPEAGDWNLDMFYNDGGNLVDEDVAVGAEYTCICDIGQIVVRKDGSIEDFDEAGTRRPLTNLPRAIHYLLSRGFDLFGLIESGAAIDSNTLTP